MKNPRYRDITAERGVRAAACVNRHLAELAQLMATAGVRYRTLEGSAIAAEVYLVETNTLHTAVRVGVIVAPDDRRAFEAALTRGAFDRCEPTGDLTLLRLASRRGRRAIHVLFGDDADTRHEGGPSRHPNDPAAVRARSARLRSAWLDLAGSYQRVRHESRETHDVTESFEVQLVDARGGDGANGPQS